MESNVGAETQTPRKPKRTKLIVGIVILVVVLIAAAVVVYLLLDAQHQRELEREREEQRLAIIESGVYHDGIVVDGTDISGMTPDAAKAAVEAALSDKRDALVYTLHFDEQEFTIGADEIGADFDAQEALDEAMQLGREGTLEELQAELADMAANPRSFSSKFSFDKTRLRASIAQIASQLNVDPIDATLTVPDTVTDGLPSITYVDEVDGVKVDEEALYSAVADMVEKGVGGDVEIPVTVTPAAVTVDQLMATFTLRSTTFTSFNKSPYNRSTRVANIKKAVGLINGTIVQPDEVFSMNGTLGNRTYAGGWQPAPAIVQGRSEDQAGGGVCQVSTTLYQAVVCADLEVVYRQGHSERLSYTDGGLDATIDSGRIDFKWKNNTSSPVYIFAWVDDSDNTIHCALYGEAFPDEFDQIVMSSKRIATIDPTGPMEFRYDPSLAPGHTEVYIKRKSGSEWESYATYLKDGQEVKTVKVATTKYRAYNGLTLVGPTPLPDVPAVPAPETQAVSIPVS